MNLETIIMLAMLFIVIIVIARTNRVVNAYKKEAQSNLAIIARDHLFFGIMNKLHVAVSEQNHLLAKEIDVELKASPDSDILYEMLRLHVNRDVISIYMFLKNNGSIGPKVQNVNQFK